MLSVKEVEFVFENCERFTIPVNAFGVLHIDGIHSVINRIACNAIEKYQVADIVALEIFKEGDASYYPFGQCDEKWKTGRFERFLQYNDITSIEIKYTDGSVDSFWTDYNEGENEGVLGAINVNQKTLKSELGNIYLVIAKDKEISDFFDMDEINDEDAVEFSKDMCDIGVEEEEEHPYGPNSIPELYRYVYLSDEHNQVLAVRVEDQECGWKYIFERPEDAIHFPTKWQYPTSKIAEFINKENKNFKLDDIKTKYPPLEK